MIERNGELEISPDLAEAHCSRGYVAHHFDRDWDTAESCYRRAVELKPEYSVVHQWFSLVLALRGRRDEARASVLRARELDPLSPVINAAVGWVHHFCGEPETAHHELTTVAMPLVGDFPWLRITLGEVLMALGRYVEAEEHFRFASDASARGTFGLSALGHCLGVTGQTQEAESIRRELTERSRREYVSPFALALVDADLGDASATRRRLETAVETRDALAGYLAVDPRFHLPGQPGIDDLLALMGLEKAP